MRNPRLHKGGSSAGSASFSICRYGTDCSTSLRASRPCRSGARMWLSLEDALADGNKFRAVSLSDEDPIGDRTLSPEDVRRVEEQVAIEAFDKRQIVVPLAGQEMNKRLLTLFRRANSDMQEGGTNTLFLAVGFLRWRKTEGDTRDYRAPLLLIPVKLERRSAQSAFSIAHHEDDVRINFTLLEFLKRDFQIRVPELEGDLPTDESGIDVVWILEAMRRRVKDVAHFRGSRGSGAVDVLVRQIT